MNYQVYSTVAMSMLVECSGEFSQALECNSLCKGTLKMFLGINLACSSYQSSQIIPRLSLVARRIRGPSPKGRLHVAILFQRLTHFTSIDAVLFHISAPEYSQVQLTY